MMDIIYIKNWQIGRILCRKFDNKGQAALLSIIFVLAISLLISLTIGYMALSNRKISRNLINSTQAYFVAEAGIEDSLYRIIRSKNYLASNSLVTAFGSAAISINETSEQKTITVSGDCESRFRKLQVVLKTNTDNVSFYYGVQVGEGGLTMDNNSIVNGSVYSNGNISGGNGATITGDVWVANLPGAINQQSSTTNSDFIFGQADPQIDAAQSFTPSISDRLTKLSLYLKKTGLPPNVTVRILTDNGGQPSKSLVASGAYGTLQASQISQSNYSWINVTLDTPPMLSAGQKYWIVIDISADNNNYFWWGKDSADSYAGGTGKYSPRWNAGSPVWTAINSDLAFKVYLGGISNSLYNMIVGTTTSSGHAHANTIDSCAIAGNAYYQTIINSTVGGTEYPNSPDPGLENLPISEANIADWKAAAVAGGVYSGNYVLTSGAVGSLGPKKIEGDLVLDNNADFTITGTLHVTGSITVSNGAQVRLGANYGNSSGVMIADGAIAVSNNAVFHASGGGSYLMFLSTKTGSAIDVDNNAETVIFYASQGTVNVKNNAILKEVTAYSIRLSNNAQVNYESGLASAKFSSGVGGGWTVESWQEVQ